MPDGNRKKRVFQHVMEDQSVRVIKDLLPNHWVIREYRPDYGIDLAVEVFRRTDEDASETLGEHFFVQAKSIQKLHTHKIKVFPRYNVAKYPPSEKPDGRRSEGLEIEVIKHPIDTPLLSTVQAMGASSVVLLFLVALDVKRVYFLCLNDYIDKVLIPEDPAFFEKDSKTLYIPVNNDVALDLVPIRFFAKRAKFYSAFNLFSYQLNELAYCKKFDEFRRLALHFIDILNGQPIWDEPALWAVLKYHKTRLSNMGMMMRDRSFPGNLDLSRYSLVGSTDDELAEFRESIARSRTEALWQGLSALGRTYEELCREWFLPTSLAQDICHADP